jgi:hypothetical protein
VFSFTDAGRYFRVFLEVGPGARDPEGDLADALGLLDSLEVSPSSPNTVTIGTPPGEGVEGWKPASFEPADGWYTATTGPLDPDLFSTPLAWASTVPFDRADLDEARDAGSLGFFPRQTLLGLEEDDVVVVAALSGHGSYPNEPTGSLPAGTLPLSLDEADVRGNWEGQVAQNIPQYVLWRTVDGWQVDVRVYFGTQEPSAETLALAQAELDRLTLPAPPETRDLALRTDSDDGVSIALPADWTFHQDPTPDLLGPRILFGAGSWTYPYPMRGVCGPAPALEDMPADGAFLWLLEYLDHQTDVPPPRPAHFSLDGLEPVIPECSAVEVEQYIIRFTEAGRQFQFQLAFGAEATDDRRGQVLAAMDDLDVTAPIPGSCPHDFGPWSDPDCPEPAWVRAVAEELGFEVVGDTGSALILDAGRRDIYMWAFTPDEDFGFEEQLIAEGYEWWRGFGTDVYFDGTRVVWFDGDRDLVVWMEGDVEGLPDEATIERIVRTSLAVDYDSIDTRS